MAGFKRPFRAVPLRRGAGRPARPPRFGRGRGRRLTAGRVRLTVLSAIFLLAAWDTYRGGAASHWRFLPWVPQPTAADPEAAWFQTCGAGIRRTCVVDGDTIWYQGENIRLLGIDAPEVAEPGCLREAELGERATLVLRDLLNAGPFSLEPVPFQPERDRYGRLLRQVTREGRDLALEMFRQGVARRYGSSGPDWCD